jgi:hypothetical protein
MSENIRFFEVVEALKKQRLLTDYVELADILHTNKAGISDLKQGRKKLSIDTIRSMKLSYPQISIEYIVMGEGDKFVNLESRITSEEVVVNDNSVMNRLFDTIDKKDLRIEELLKENARLEERLRLTETERSDFDHIAGGVSTESTLSRTNQGATSAGAPLKD